MTAVLEHARPGVSTRSNATPLDIPEIRAAQRTLVAVAVFAAAAGAIHTLVSAEHIMQYAEGMIPGYLALGFTLAAGVGLVYAMSLLAVTVTRGWLVAGIILHAPMAAIGLWSRTVGLPGAELEGPTVLWGLATFSEVAVLMAATFLLVWGPKRIRLSRRQVLTAVVLAALAAGVGFLAAPQVLDHISQMGQPFLATPAGWMW